MKYLLTLNMPSMTGNMVQQIIVEHRSKSCGELTDVLNESQFVNFSLWYRFQEPDDTYRWEDRGEIVINTDHIGKVQYFIEKASDDSFPVVARSTRNSGSKGNSLRSV